MFRFVVMSEFYLPGTGSTVIIYRYRGEVLQLYIVPAIDLGIFRTSQAAKFSTAVRALRAGVAPGGVC
jgi:hypothetical protein